MYNENTMARTYTLKRRAQFLRIRKGARWATSAFVLEAKPRDDEAAGAGQEARFGFTVTKQIGKAVERNRIRRRLREVVRLSGGAQMKAGHDYVLIGRREALRLPFDRMSDEFAQALKRAHKIGGKDNK